MRVLMTQQVSGGRNGQPWPAAGEEIDLPDAEARAAIQGGTAVEAGKPSPDKVAVPPAGIHVPGATGFAHGSVGLVEVPADALSDPEGVRAALVAREAGDSATSVPAGTGVQRGDGSAMSAEHVGRVVEDDERSAREWGVGEPVKPAARASSKSAEKSKT